MVTSFSQTPDIERDLNKLLNKHHEIKDDRTCLDVQDMVEKLCDKYDEKKK